MIITTFKYIQCLNPLKKCFRNLRNTMPEQASISLSLIPTLVHIKKRILADCSLLSSPFLTENKSGLFPKDAAVQDSNDLLFTTAHIDTEGAVPVTNSRKIYP